MAAKVLYLSTLEFASDGIAIVNNGYAGVVNAVGASDVIDRRSGLGVTGATGVPAIAQTDIDDADIIVAVTVYQPVANDKMNLLTDIMLNDPSKTVIIFTDGCCSVPQNMTKFAETLATGTGWAVGISGGLGGITSPRNTKSTYSALFSDTITGGAYRLFVNVPGENALYLPHNTQPANFPENLDLTSAFGFLVPQPSMNGGNGACTFAVGDSSPFNSATQAESIMEDFLVAATDPAGACAMRSATVDLEPSISGPTDPAVGSIFSLGLAVQNHSTSNNSTDGSLTVTLPPGLRVTAGAVLPAGCSIVPGSTPTTDQQIQCTLGVIAAANSITLPIPVVTDVVGTPLTVSAVVSGVTGENITTNNNATFVLTAGPARVATPVPVGGWPALLLLSLLLPFLSLRRRLKING